MGFRKRWRVYLLLAGVVAAVSILWIRLIHQGATVVSGVQQVEPPPPPLLTRWAANVSSQAVPWPEYPRPGLARGEWLNLNGRWRYAVTPATVDQAPSAWDGRILVPFGLESALSGVRRSLRPSQALWYRRWVVLPPLRGRLLFLNFEAVDYRCQVWVNGQQVGTHVGGFTPFRFNISAVAREGNNSVVVRVEDATGGVQLRGKQTLKPKRIWYTPTSGIWQTVWLEWVPKVHIARLDMVTRDARAGLLYVTARVLGTKANQTLRFVVEVLEGSVVVATGEVKGVAQSNVTVRLTVASPALWTPETPHLYDVKARLRDGASAEVLDEVRSYVGLRTVGRVPDALGHPRLALNGEPVFHYGTLDQGFWPDGLLTPPSDEAMQHDLRFLKAAGFNLVRKHVKVEPRRYYYHCDRMGFLVWQDQVSGGPSSPHWTRLAPAPADAIWAAPAHGQYLREFEAMVTTLYNHPCIVVWVPFNEAWGQHLTLEVGSWAVARDPSRHVNVASGGNFWPVGHIVDHHNYPEPDFPFNESRFGSAFVKVVGEFGGHGLIVEGHTFNRKLRNWGYGSLPATQDELKERYARSIGILSDLRTRGIAAGVYTQTTDVETELNGLMTYDREVVKIPASTLREMHKAVGLER